MRSALCSAPFLSLSLAVLLHGASAGCDGTGRPADAAEPRAPDADLVDAAADAELVDAVLDAEPREAGPIDAARDLGPDVPRPPVTLETYPRVDGSTSTIPLARLIACELLGIGYRWQPGLGGEGEAEIVPVAATPEQQPLADGIMARIVHNKTHEAYLNLIDGNADLILVASTPSEDERAHAAARSVTLDWRPVALDALVFIVNEVNPTTTLTTAQLREIFAGRITAWNEVGDWSGDIHPYVRPPNSGSQQLVESLLMRGEPMADWPPDRIVRFMGALIDQVRTDPQAIGFSVYYYVTYQSPATGYGILAVDGIAPEHDTLADRSYPLSAEVWVVVRDDLERASLAGQLRDWLLTPDGQRVVGRSGYVPVAP